MNATGDGSRELVVPSLIPWEHLTSALLEEVLYYLLDEMGAASLEWRKGGVGDGAADGGRDIEAVFERPRPDGDLERERWWIEAKGRKGSVPKDQVTVAANNVLSRRDVDCLVIATNSVFTNPTTDWVSDWQKTHPRPLVKLWDRAKLERLLVRHPSVALRFFSEALTPQGHLAAVRLRFWHHLHYAGVDPLRMLWPQRQTLEWSSEAFLACIVGEVANGTLSHRPWLVHAPVETLRAVVALGWTNLGPLLVRAERTGIAQSPITRALGYATLALLRRASAEEVASIVESALSRLPSELHAPGLRGRLLRNVLLRLQREISDYCVATCARMQGSVPRNFDPDADGQYDARFWRAKAEALAARAENPATSRILMTRELPCGADFTTTGTVPCALFQEKPDAPLVDSLRVLKQAGERLFPERDPSHGYVC